ncbi:MAG TPA: hypothetical protein VFW89_07880 [Gemmatimonadaceae bacterium]|nr:hypothetical protein [Gemmatimonadaceae bacterium]
MSVVYFTDRDLGKQFPNILSTAGLSVERHCDQFAPNCPDEEWLAEIARRGWVALTHDRRIRYKPNELAAVKTHRVSLLVVVGTAPFVQLAHAFVRTEHQVLQFLERNPPPVIAKVYRPSPADLERNPGAGGRVERWYPKV